MRVTIVTDVHSNLAALESVLQQAESVNALDQVWSMGDLVGYGPQPSECLTLLRGYDFQSVTGNHDLAVVGGIDTSEFNPAAATANHWNAARLNEEERKFLLDLPQTMIRGDVSLVHGSLRNPVWEYMYTVEAAVEQFQQMTTQYSLVGHTHIPLIFLEQPDGRIPAYRRLEDAEVIDLGGQRLIMNPGGVGQPRDGDPRAGFAIYDSEAGTVSFHRVPYDIGRTQAMMADAGLPASLINRLARGR